MNGVAGYAGAIVNPALTQALESSQHALWRLGVTGAAMVPTPSKGEGDRLRQWQPDVRGAIWGFEVAQDLVFRAESQDSATLGLWVPNPAGVKATFKALLTLTAPSDATLMAQAQAVAEKTRFRSMPKSQDPSRERLLEITTQTTPAFAFWSQILPLHPDRTPRTLELMQVALGLANHAVQRLKHALDVRRPHRINHQVMPAILTPAHGSLPSGHATEAFTIAWVLSQLVDGDRRALLPLTRTQLALAYRIAENREYAGVHYEIDSIAGQVLGTVMADYLIARCTADENATVDVEARAFNPEVKRKQKGVDAAADVVDLVVSRIPAPRGAVPVGRSEPLAWLWTQASAEWH
ncbi:membrane-associated phospholipid phosphatase [Sphaerotilus mobilis]|uniref:Membrane-associated phospholipid phosphatase n=2 Tax=Sphaerotilus mobilis TaxID=47994 RepID=A0A4Q7LI17_9BURK|nr:membrane-associated phospholipid phosphatase [Sphaerotilus mobilis]